MWDKLAPILSKRCLQHIHAACLSLTPLAPHFAEIKISLDEISFFSFSYHFVAVIDLLLGLLPVQKFLRIKAILQDRQFVPWRAKLVAGNFGLRFLFKFLSNFPCTSQAPLNRSFWSLYHWKDRFLLETLNRDDAKVIPGMEQRPTLIMACRQHRSQWVKHFNMPVKVNTGSVYTMQYASFVISQS